MGNNQLKKQAALDHNFQYENRQITVSVQDSVGITTEETTSEMKPLQSKQEEKITASQYAERMGWDKIPKFPINKKTYNVRRLFNQLTKEERIALRKQELINHGTMKMYSLLAKIGVGV